MKQESIHPNIRDLPTGTLMPFPSDLALPEGWKQCNGDTIFKKTHPKFVEMMYRVFVTNKSENTNPAEKLSYDTFKRFGFKSYKLRTVLPDFRGSESILSFGADLDDLDIVLAIKIDD